MGTGQIVFDLPSIKLYLSPGEPYWSRARRSGDEFINIGWFGAVTKSAQRLRLGDNTESHLGST